MEKDSGPSHKRTLTFRQAAIGLAILVAILLAGMAGRYIYLKYRYPESNALAGVPRNAMMVVEAKGILAFMGSLSGGPLWQQGFSATGSPDYLNQITGELKGLLEKGDPSFREILNNQSFCMALVPKKQDGPAFLFTLQLPDGINPSSIHTFIRQNWPSYSEKRLLEISYHERVLPDGSPLYLTIRDGILLASTDREVFELAYYTVESGNCITMDDAFMKVHGQISKSQNPAVRAFISYEGYYSWMMRFMDPFQKPLIASLPDFGTWAAMEVDLNLEGAHLQGFTDFKPGTSTPPAFMQPVTEKLKNPGRVLPANTVYYDQMAVASFGEHHSRYIRSYLDGRDGDVISYPVPTTTVDSMKSTLDGAGIRSITLAVTEPFDTMAGSNYLLCLQSQDAAGLFREMTTYSDSTRMLNYQGFIIATLNRPYLVPALFGSHLNVFTGAFFTLSEDHVIIAPSERALLSVLNAISLNRTLASDEGYRSCSGIVAGRLNRRIYLDRTTGDGYFRSLIAPGKQDRFEKLSPFLPVRMMMGFSKENDVLLTDVVLKASSKAVPSQAGREIVLDEVPAAQPLLITDHRDKTTKVMVADHAGNLYLISPQGNLEWKMEVKEQPLSGLQVIDLYRNGRQQCMFFSRNLLHVVQIDGQYVPGFPVMLANPFHSQLAVFDYESNGNYRLIYRDIHSRLGNVDISGKPVAGWTNPPSGPLRRPLKYLKNGPAEYLVAVDTTGKVTFYDRRGRERIALPASLQMSNNSGIVMTRSLDRNLFTLLDRQGYVWQVTADGVATRNEVMHFHPSALLFERGTEGAGEIVVVEPDGISVFDRDLKLLEHSGAEGFITEKVMMAKDASVLFAGLDQDQAPYMVLRKGMKKLQLSDQSFDLMMLWRQKPGEQWSLLLGKGLRINIRQI